MKKTILLTSIIAIAIVSMLSSCVDSEKDLYDPSYQTANPMGDGFAAPDGFLCCGGVVPMLSRSFL